jgi:hypothetical protein
LRATGGFLAPDADRFFRLDANGKRSVALQIAPGANGVVNGEAVATAGGTEADLALSATAAGTTTTYASAPAAISNPQDSVPTDAAQNPGDDSNNYYTTRALKILSATRQGAVLEWTPGFEAAGWRVEVLAPALSGSDDVLEDWVPMKGVQFSRENAKVTARTGPLTEGALYVLRMAALDAKGDTLAVSGVANGVIPAPEKSHMGGIVICMGILVAGGAGFWFWRSRRRAEAEF